MGGYFKGFDLATFWEESAYATESYVDPHSPTEEVISELETALGYKIPKAYLALARFQNGGCPRNTCHRIEAPRSWADDHVAITGILSIGYAKSCSLGGAFGSRFYMAEWGYPNIGIYFADCPSAGHDMLCLDYRDCGVDGEPRVVHVDQESDYAVTVVASDFESFIRGLEHEDAFDES